MARGEAGPDSDVDLLVEIDPDAGIGFAVVSLRQELASLVGRPVDIAFSNRLRPSLKGRIERELIGIF